MSNNSSNNPELIKCGKKNCVYNENGECALFEVTLDANGECTDQQSW